jgi:hypothetical protein
MQAVAVSSWRELVHSINIIALISCHINTIDHLFNCLMHWGKAFSIYHLMTGQEGNLVPIYNYIYLAEAIQYIFKQIATIEIRDLGHFIHSTGSGIKLPLLEWTLSPSLGIRPNRLIFRMRMVMVLKYCG